MIRVCLIFCCSFLLSARGHCPAMDIEYIRTHYGKAVSDKELCASMIATLEKTEKNDVELAYWGALQTIWANHVLNPVSKLNTFYNGRANIEKAISRQNNNVEIRFIRLSVQKNCPGFLGYNKNIQEDEVFLRANKKNIASEELLKMVEKLLNA